MPFSIGRTSTGVTCEIRTVGAGGLIVVGVGAFAFAVVGPGFGSSSSTTQYLTSQAAVTDVVSQVAATGSVQVASAYNLAFGSAPAAAAASSSSSSSGSGSGSSSSSGSSSWNVTAVNATPGQAVKAGDVLAVADGTTATLAVTIATANLDAATAKLALDKRGLSANDKAAAKLQVTQAQTSLANARTAYSQTAAQNSLKLRQAQAALVRARNQLAADQKASPAVPANVIASDTNAVTQATDSLASLRLQVSQSNGQASNQITSASLGLQSAQLAYSTKVAPTSAQTIASDQAQVAQAQQSLATAQTALQYATLKSPVDGFVVAVNVTAGATAPSGTAISVRSGALQVGATVAESDLPKMQLGQDATVSITALGASVTGKVVDISQTGSSSGSGGVVSYAIVVSLPQPPTGVAPGMSAQVNVTTASATGVLAVPSIALQGSAGSYSVRVLDAGVPQAVSVEVGLVTSSLAEIKSGISAGTAVVVGTTSSRISTSGTGTGNGTRIPGVNPGGFGGGFGGGTRVVTGP